MEKLFLIIGSDQIYSWSDFIFKKFTPDQILFSETSDENNPMHKSVVIRISDAELSPDKSVRFRNDCLSEFPIPKLFLILVSDQKVGPIHPIKKFPVIRQVEDQFFPGELNSGRKCVLILFWSEVARNWDFPLCMIFHEKSIVTSYPNAHVFSFFDELVIL